jgi:hypothetical protein
MRGRKAKSFSFLKGEQLYKGITPKEDRLSSWSNIQFEKHGLF